MRIPSYNLVNWIIIPVSASKIYIGVFRSIPQTRQMLGQLMHEVINTAQAYNINFSEDGIVHTLAFIDKLPFSGAASMQRDIMEGRP
jgi:2-dehydropantoate 2-reductase